MKIAVFTCITKSYLPLVDPAVVDPSADYICFSDTPIKSKVWEHRQLEPFFDSQVRNSRLPKILSHRYLPDYDFTIYHDATLQIAVPPEELVGKMKQGDLALFRNRQRRNLGDEFDRVRSSLWTVKGLVDLGLLQAQQEFYQADLRGRRIRKSMIFYGAVLVRRHCPEIFRFNELWFREYCLWQVRDLSSMNYALVKQSVSTSVLNGTPKSNPYLRCLKKKKRKKKK